jgi:hypothetical protein
MKRSLAVVICAMAQPAMGDCISFGDTGLLINVDGAYQMSERDGGATLTLEPNGRAPKVIAIGAAEVIDAQTTVILENGLSLAYWTDVEEAVGSGGGAAFLQGRLESAPPMNVTCMMQDESPEAEWCLPLLGQIRTMAEGCKPKEE